MCKVSVIVPVYKVEQYLEKCLLSIVNQSYKNLQIILVDDGSPDNCGKICDEWEKKDHRIEVIHKQNGGLSDARNAGIARIKGEYVLFVDSDDWIHLNMIENMIDAALKYDCEMIICQFLNVFPDGKQERISEECGDHLYNKEEAIKLLLKDSQITNHIWRKLLRKDIVNENLFPVGRNFEDIFVNVDLFYKCDKIYYIDEPYYYYFQNNAGIVKTVNMKNCIDHMDAGKHVVDFITNNFASLSSNVYAYFYFVNVASLMDASYVSEIKKNILREFKSNIKSIPLKTIRSFKLHNKIIFILIKIFPDLALVIYPLLFRLRNKKKSV